MKYEEHTVLQTKDVKSVCAMHEWKKEIVQLELQWQW